MTKAERGKFMRRTYNVYRHQKTRLGDLPYSIHDFREKVEAALGIGYCLFCRKKLTVSNFSADHSTPVSKGGSKGLWNVSICCGPCNRAKGPMDAPTFKRFLEWIYGNLPREDTNWIIGRLKAGGAAQFARRKK